MRLNLRRKQLRFNAVMMASVVVGCLAFLWLVAPLAATAAPPLTQTINVDTTTDELSGNNGACSLREAIQVANSGSNAAYPECALSGTADGTYTINVPAGTYTLMLAGAGEDDNATGDLDIQSSVSIVGAGAGSTIVQAGTGADNGIDRVFHVESGANASISNLTVQYGAVTTTGATDGGGGILNQSTLAVSDAMIATNNVTGTGASGGGILNTGTLSMSNSTVSGNSSLRAGGGIETTAGATVTLTTVNLYSNSTATSPGNGGGLHMTGAGHVSVTGGEVMSNTAGAEGGGLWNGSGTMTVNGTNISNNAAAGSGADQGGGGLFNAGGTMTVMNATIDSNLASGGAVFALDGGQEVPAVTTSAMGEGIFLYNAVAGTFHLDLFVTGLELTDLTGAHIHQAAAGANGGVIVDLLASASFSEVPGGLRLLLSNQTFPAAEVANLLAGDTYINVHSSANAGGEVRGQITFPATMGSGGGILNDQGTLTVNDSTITNNVASRAGGGIEANVGTNTLSNVTMNSNVAGPSGAATPGNGGGLHITGAGDANITGGQVMNNSAGAEGGGLWNGSGTMSVNGTTINSNTASGASADQGGGGLFNAGGTMTVMNATISGNVANGASGSGGGILNDAGGTTTVSASTISGNTSNRAGGGIETTTEGATVNLTNVDLLNNSTGNSPGNGGGLHMTGNGVVTVTGGDVMSNTAGAEGGGLWNGSGTMTIDGTMISDNIASGNEADQGGGGLFNAGGTMTVMNATISDNVANGTAGSGGGILNDNGNMTVSDTTISGNIGNRAGGGIEDTTSSRNHQGGTSLTLTNVNLTNNHTGSSPGNGGGLHVTGAGTIMVTGGNVTGNMAAAEGGGLWNGSGTMTIDGTMISNNAAAGSGASQGGGGVFNAGGTLNIANATIDSNLASGGAVFALDGSQEVPAVTTSAMGEGIFLYNAVAGTFHLDLFVTGLELTDLTGAHIHQAAAGANGGVIVDLLASATFKQVPGGLRLLLENQAFPAAEVANLLAGETYVNVHSTANAGGEVRGQITFPATMGSGGGILNDQGTLTVNDSTITNNVASRAGGGIEANVGTNTLSNVTMNSNVAGPSGAATPGNGGGLHITGAGDANITGGQVMNNSAGAEGGGLWNGSGTMSVNGTTINSNTASGASADQGGGGLFNAGGTLNVMNATINGNVADGASGSGGGILNDAGGALTVSASTISGNTSMRAGGGIEDNASTTSLNGVILDGNETGDSPGNGGGLHISGAGTATVTDSTVQNNTATEGGGLWNAGAGTLTVDGTTLNNNTADGTADGQDGGGGIYNDGALTVVNSTLYENSGPIGGGISNVGGNANATVVNSTLYENSQGGISNNGGTLELNQSIVAHDTAMGDDCSGTITATNANLDSDGSCGASLTGNPLLGALADNGGPTFTHALMKGSPALDAGSNAICAAAPVNGVDQRNAARPVGDSCDLGAYEAGGTPTAIVLHDITANKASTLPFALLALGVAGAVIGLIWRRRRTT